MKPAVMTCIAALVGLSLTGCPIYPADDLCRSDWDCAEGYYCNRATGACLLAGPAGCSRPSDCTGPSEVCSRDGICKVGSCHLSNVGCVTGYSCVGSGPELAWHCVPTGSVGGTGGAPSLDDAGTMGGEMSVGGEGTGGSTGTEQPADAG